MGCHFPTALFCRFLTGFFCARSKVVEKIQELVLYYSYRMTGLQTVSTLQYFKHYL